MHTHSVPAGALLALLEGDVMRLGYNPTTAGLYALEAGFRLAEELGLEFIELDGGVQEMLPRLQPLKRARELSRATGIDTTAHLPFIDLNIASLIPAARRTAVERTLRGLEVATAAGARCAVLHSGQIPFWLPEVEDGAFAALEQSLLELRAPPVPLALENIAPSRLSLVRGPGKLREVACRANLHTCLDFGHAFLERDGEDHIADYIRTLGDNIIHLHLHGNDGNADQHLPTDEGAIPYQRYAGYLRDFPGTICLEVTGGADAVRRSIGHLRALLYSLA